MSDFIGHECGLALVRLRKPLSYYCERYGDPAWGLRRLYLLMEKQHNRGQDGAGVASVQFDLPPGEQFLKRVRSDRNNALERIFDEVMPKDEHSTDGPVNEIELKLANPYLGEVLLGHLRYGTHSGRAEENCHPLIRRHIVASKNLATAGNFNMTNSARLFQQLLEDGLNPVGDSDTQVVLERLGWSLDHEHAHLRAAMGPGSFQTLTGRELAEAVSKELNLVRIVERAAVDWDGGYVLAAALGNGDAMVCRDPAGIRPASFYIDDEVIAVASERVALSSVFNVHPDEVQPVKPGHVLSIKRDGAVRHEPFTHILEERQCTFERIYFSRGNDPAIYQERKALGSTLAQRVYDAIDGDLDRTVFSFIPNTAETAYLGLTEAVDRLGRERRIEAVWQRLQSGQAGRAELDTLLNGRIRAEKVAHKDQRLRTFITHDAALRDLVTHIYDITRGVVQEDDTLVVLDDSIVRGTTLRDSIMTILSRLNPKRIIVVSSAPPIMYPDCYGIDMSRLGRFIAFEAAVLLAKERGGEAFLADVERRCLEQRDWDPSRMHNHVASIYELSTLDEVSLRVSELIRPADLTWRGQIDVIYQSIEGLHAAIPEHTGDWVFTGRYPTPGGYRVVNTSYLNWRRNVDARAYEDLPEDGVETPLLPQSA